MSAETISGHEQPTNEVAARPVIEMRGVGVGTLRNPKAVVAKDVNWRVQAGEFWAIGGLHGTGKSDLLMLAGGVMAPAQGSYEFMGEAMPAFSEEQLPQRLKLGLVFETGRLFNRLTIAENVTLPLRYHRNLAPDEAEALVQPLLEMVELASHAHALPGTLNRNWQRRVALARTLVLRPEVLLLDAPLVGLDPRQQGWWFDFLDQLFHGHQWFEGRPVTIILTTASFRPWRSHATRFAMLNDHRFTVLGDWAEVERSSDPLIKELAGGG
jgi:phospholipid/cholesterol/gamma-HCH transport system ATP-binding protein